MSFPGYPEYKDSRVPWLGDVPGHWRADRISRLFGVIGSGTTPSAPEAFESGTINWVTTGELREQPIFATTKQVTETAVAELSALQVYPKGTLLIAMYGATIGRLGWLEIPACTNQACCAMAEPTDLVPRFAFHCLSVATEALILLSSGGGQPNINQEKVRAFRLPVPPLREQRAITAFLDRETAKIDALVAEQERLIALLKEKRQAVISHAVTKGLNPHAPMKDSGIEWLGEIPAHWSVPKLKHFATFSGGGTPDRENMAYWEGDIPWVSPKDMKSELISDSAERITEIGLNHSATNLTPTGAVLIVVRSGILRHTIPVAINAVPVTLNQDMKAIRVKPHACMPEFLFRWIQGFNRELLMAWSKQGATVESIEHQYLAETSVPLPPIEEQTQIVSFIDLASSNFDTLIDEAQAAITLLQERRTALISAAVTGKIDVRGLVDAPAAAELETV